MYYIPFSVNSVLSQAWQQAYGNKGRCAGSGPIWLVGNLQEFHRRDVPMEFFALLAFGIHET